MWGTKHKIDCFDSSYMSTLQSDPEAVTDDDLLKISPIDLSKKFGADTSSRAKFAVHLRWLEVHRENPGRSTEDWGKTTTLWIQSLRDLGFGQSRVIEEVVNWKADHERRKGPFRSLWRRYPPTPKDVYRAFGVLKTQKHDTYQPNELPHELTHQSNETMKDKIYEKTYRGVSEFEGPPPGNYICNRCGKKGHHLQVCPTNLDPAYDKPPGQEYRCLVCGQTGKHKRKARAIEGNAQAPTTLEQWEKSCGMKRGQEFFRRAHERSWLRDPSPHNELRHNGEEEKIGQLEPVENEKESEFDRRARKYGWLHTNSSDNSPHHHSDKNMKSRLETFDYEKEKLNCFGFSSANQTPVVVKADPLLNNLALHHNNVKMPSKLVPINDGESFLNCFGFMPAEKFQALAIAEIYEEQTHKRGRQMSTPSTSSRSSDEDSPTPTKRQSLRKKIRRIESYEGKLVTGKLLHSREIALLGAKSAVKEELEALVEQCPEDVMMGENYPEGCSPCNHSPASSQESTNTGLSSEYKPVSTYAAFIMELAQCHAEMKEVVNRVNQRPTALEMWENDDQRGRVRMTATSLNIPKAPFWYGHSTGTRYSSPIEYCIEDGIHPNSKEENGSTKPQMLFDSDGYDAEIENWGDTSSSENAYPDFLTGRLTPYEDCLEQAAKGTEEKVLHFKTPAKRTQSAKLKITNDTGEDLMTFTNTVQSPQVPTNKLAMKTIAPAAKVSGPRYTIKDLMSFSPIPYAVAFKTPVPSDLKDIVRKKPAKK